MSSLQMFVLLAVIVAMAAAYPQSYESPYKAPSAPAYSAPAYSPPSYSAPAYSPPSHSAPSSKGAGTAKGRVKIQVYRGPNKDGANGKDSFAPWGFYANQPEDNKPQGY